MYIEKSFISELYDNMNRFIAFCVLFGITVYIWQSNSAILNGIQFVVYFVAFLVLLADILVHGIGEG